MCGERRRNLLNPRNNCSLIEVVQDALLIPGSSILIVTSLDYHSVEISSGLRIVAREGTVVNIEL